MLAIIPARGGSKGLPGKNLRKFNGEPLICVTIKEALKAERISQVIVSTDDEAIAKAARTCGAQVPFMRPSELASDHIKIIDTYLYTLERLNEEGAAHEAFIVLLPTAPLRLAKHMDEAIALFKEKQADSVISVTESPFPVEWTRKVSQEGILSPYVEDGNDNRQAYKKTYVPNGQIYVFNYKRLKETRNYYMDKTYAYITDKRYYGDIDDEEDFELTAFKYRRNLEKAYL